MRLPVLTGALLLVPTGALFLVACGSEEDAPNSEVPSSAEAPFYFVDVTTASGLGTFRQVSGTAAKPYINESFGAGVALVDVDGDGDLDVYLTNGSTQAAMDSAGSAGPADALYLNDGSGHFEDGTAAAGLGDQRWTYGVTVGDYDGDGHPDLYITNDGPNRLYRNRGDGTFEDVTAATGVGGERWSTGATFLDYDRDGDLDLYVVNHIAFDRAAIVEQGLREKYFDAEVYYGPGGLDAASDVLYRNDGEHFTDVSQESGIGAVALYGFHVVSFDYDRDGWPDLYVANDSTPNLLWHNRGDGTFEDVAPRAGVALSLSGDSQAGMGVAVGDYDGDGIVDLYVTNFSEDYFTLYQGGPRHLYRDVTTRANLYRATLASLGWAAGFEDFDADGDLDLYVVNGHVFPQVDELGRQTRYLQRNLLFENTADGRFRIPVGEGGPGFTLAAASRGAAVGDVDGDGDLDLLVGNLDGPPTLLRNESPSAAARSVLVLLLGQSPNTAALGARVVAVVGERRMLRLVGCNSGFLSSGDRRLHFGLGQAQVIDVLEITWPDGTMERVEGLSVGHTVTIGQGAGVVASEPFRQP